MNNKKLHNLRAEFGKITWPTRVTVIKESAVVSITTLILGAIIKLVDMIMQTGISFLVR